MASKIVKQLEQKPVDNYAEVHLNDIAWVILNRLEWFNDKPELISELSRLFVRLDGHTYFHMFAPMYEEAVRYYAEQGSFPDLKYLDSRFPEGKMIKIMTHSEISMPIYHKLLKQLQYEVIIQDFNDVIGSEGAINIEACKYFAKTLTKFAENTEEIPQDTKDEWLNSYSNFTQTFHGLSTGIKTLDEDIGTLSGLTTIAAPSGNGKSTFALSLAYNIATQIDPRTGAGGNVLYISFEMTKFQLQANLVSIESSFSKDEKDRLQATVIKEAKLNPEQEELYKKHMNNFMKRLNFSGGYISLVDNTSMTGYDTIEGFMASIEELSAKLNKNFDIIFIDNVDSLNILRGDRGTDDMSKMNGFITKLDAFSKTYMDGYGTTVVLLSQTNRDGFKKIKAMDDNGAEQITIDYTVLQRYSALYERATMVLVLYSSPNMRSSGLMKLMPVKLRNKPMPNRPLTLSASWPHSYIGGSYIPPKITEEDIKELANVEFECDEDDFSDDDMITGLNNIPEASVDEIEKAIDEANKEPEIDSPPWDEDDI